MIVQFQHITPRLSQEDLIRNAQEEEDRFILDAMRAHFVRETERQERQRRRRVVNIVFGCVLGAAIAASAMLVLILAR